MQLDTDLAIIHQPTRLKIMGLLWRQRDVRFAAAKKALDLSDGNLATHANRLEEVGFLTARRVLVGDHFEMRYALTKAGKEAFKRYLVALQDFLEDAEGTE